jgi:hypothetical protein
MGELLARADSLKGDLLVALFSSEHEATYGSPSFCQGAAPH